MIEDVTRKRCDDILDGLADDIREYVKVAIKHLGNSYPTISRDKSYLELYSQKIPGTIIRAAIEELASDHVECGEYDRLLKEVKRIIESEEDKIQPESSR